MSNRTIALLAASLIFPTPAWACTTGASNACIPRGETLPGEVKADALFSFMSTFDTEEGYLRLNHCVINEDPALPLVFLWEKTGLVAPPLSPLLPGCAVQDPHPVLSVANNPDTDAPILYTQSKRRKSAAIYVENEDDKTSTFEEGERAEVESAPVLRSDLSTAFLNDEEEIQTLRLTIHSDIEDDGEGLMIWTTVERDPATLLVAPSGDFRLLLTRRHFATSRNG